MRWFRPQPTTAEQMRRLFSPVSRLRPLQSGKPWMFVLLHNAKGESLIRKHAALLFRRTA